MDLVAPAGPVYQAGTLSGNPLAMTAGLSSLQRLSARLYKQLSVLGTTLQVNAYGATLTPFFATSTVTDYHSAVAADTKAHGRFFHAMLDRGIYPPPSQFEAWFVSAAHTDRHIQTTIRAAKGAMVDVARSTRMARIRR